MPYDEAAAGFVDDNRSRRGIGYIIAATAFIVLAFAIFHFIRVRASDVAA